MIVIEPTLMSQRPPQPPAVIAAQSGVVNSTSTPSRLAISVATSMSKPSYVPSGFSSDCGGYFGSVETTSLPAFLILSSRPPAIGGRRLGGASTGTADAERRLGPDGAAAAGAARWARAVAAPPPLEQAAATMATAPSMDSRPRRDMCSSLFRAPVPVRGRAP